MILFLPPKKKESIALKGKKRKKLAEYQGKATIQNSTVVPPYRDMFNLTCSIECCIITRFGIVNLATGFRIDMFCSFNGIPIQLMRARRYG